MTTGDELLLLAIVPGRQRIRIRSDNRLLYALRTSELADLCLAGRIAVRRRRIEVLDTRPVEDRRLSNVLQGLGAPTPPPGLKDWLRRTPRSLTVEYLSRLEDQKAVRVRRGRDSSGRTRNDILSVDMPRRQALLTRLDSVVRSGSARSAADRHLTLAVLAQAAGLAPAAYPGLRGITDRRRMAALAATHRPTAAAAGAVPIADVELAQALTTGADVLTRQLLGEHSDLYADLTTGGHGLGHGLDSGGWSEGGAGGTGHHGDGHAGW
ncbi:GPP34 family phosphoprotein [Streptomyces sp. SM13]|uniref:GOLPH3/VPS74 family protein n=1 Tax=Streptomyces sp. SM13 TaxID=1983803 RepID=UPI0015E18D1E|nr:GPP34 family phosphoprotein [Streptomyces sp. SM13]